MFTKGYKQIWSSDAHELKKVQGVNGVLDDGQIVKLNDLQVIPKPKRNHWLNPPELRKEVEKEAKGEGIEECGNGSE